MQSDERYIWQTAEADAAGTLTQEQQAELNTRLAADPAFAQAYKEYYHTIIGLEDSGRRRRFKAMLQDVHAEVTTPKQSITRKVISFRPQYLRTAAVAASIAILTSLITVWSLRNDAPKSVSQNIQLVRHEMENIKRTQQHQQQQIQQIKEGADANTAPAPPQSNYTGTGFALSNDGFLITNYHVVEGAQNLQIITRNGKSHPASVIAYEPKNDIALLKIDDESFRFGKGELPYAFAQSKASLGAPIYTLGFPQDEIVYNEGYIAARNGYEGDSNQYRLEVPSGPGQSGAPVVDNAGNVIGIISSKASQTESTTYAITSKALLRLLRDVPKTHSPRLPKAGHMAGLNRQQQIEKIQDYTCMVQVYKK
jgi:S1-C subfamily serine protease